jgi:hypothetical protein
MIYTLHGKCIEGGEGEVVTLGTRGLSRLYIALFEVLVVKDDM